MDEISVYHSDTTLFQVFKWFLIALYTLLSLISLYRLKYHIPHSYKNYIITLTIFIFLIGISNLYIARIILFLSTSWNISTASKEIISNLTEIIFVLLTILFTDIILRSYCTYQITWNDTKKYFLKILVRTLFCFVLLVDIGLIIADFATENHKSVHNGVTYFNGLLWIFIISCVVASVFMFVEVAKSYFSPEDLPQIKKKAFMIAALVVYTAVVAFSMFFIFRVVHGKDERYGIFRSVLYFFYYVLDDLVPLGILLVYIFKIKGYSESTLEDIASEIIRQHSDGFISLTSHKA